MLSKWSDFEFSDMDRTFSALNELRREMDKVFADFGSGFGLGNSFAMNTGPAVNVRDTGAELVVKAEVPGVSESELTVSVDKGNLSIRCERKDEIPEGYAVHRKERRAFTAVRTLSLPCKVASEKVKASLANGVLEIVLPKAPESQPRLISVNAGGVK